MHDGLNDCTFKWKSEWANASLQCQGTGSVAKNLKGKIKEGFGKATGDAKTEAEGRADQAEGKVQNTVGGAKDKARALQTTGKLPQHSNQTRALAKAGAFCCAWRSGWIAKRPAARSYSLPHGRDVYAVLQDACVRHWQTAPSHPWSGL